MMGRVASILLAVASAIACVSPGNARGQDTPEILDAYLAASNAGRYRDSEQIARKGIATAIQTGNEEAAAEFCDMLGQSLYVQSKFGEAEAAYKQSIAMFERLFGPEYESLNGCLNNLAVLYSDLGRYSEAEPLHKRAIALEAKRVGPDHPDYALGLNNLGLLYRRAGRFTEAATLFLRAIAIHERMPDPSPVQLARSLNNLGEMLGYLGRFAEAEPFCKRALAIRERSLGPEHVHVANSLDWLGGMYKAQGRFTEAESFLKRAVPIYEKSELGPEDLARCLAKLAGVYDAEKRYAEAEALMKRAIPILVKIFGREDPSLQSPISTLAEILSHQGRDADAMQLLNYALSILDKASGENRIPNPDLLMALARTKAAMGEAEEAEKAVTQAIERATQIGSDGGYRSTLVAFRADLRWKANRREDAVADLNEAIRLADDQRGSLGGGEVERAESFSQFLGFFQRMVAWQVELGNVAAAFDAIERSRARSLLDEMKLAGADLQNGRPAAERIQVERDEALLRERVDKTAKQLASIRSDPARKDEAKRLGDELSEARTRLYEHARDVRTSSPVYRDLLNRGAGPPALDQVQRKLCGDGGSLLIYLFAKEGGYVLSIGADRAKITALKLDDADAKSLGSTPGPLTADRLQAILVGSKGSGLVARLADPKAEGLTPSLAALWRVLVPEAERKALVDGTAKRLVVVPDGPLAFLPFETLVVEADDEPKYLLDAGPPIVYAPSATILLSVIDRPGVPSIKDRDPVLALGDPAYPLAAGASATGSDRGMQGSRQRYAMAGGSLPRLPFSGQEAKWVAQAFKDAGIKAGTFLGEGATEAGVRYWAPGRKLLHLACHGLADQSLGNFYGALALTPGPRADSDPTDDGFLMLPEIYGLDLKGCELAILSACQTNFGPQQSGEGTWSLSRGFVVAGARRVVASNWLVDDEAAASLISVFCSGIARDQKEGKSVDYAGDLHRARRWVRAQEKWKAPYYWASLVQIGPP